MEELFENDEQKANGHKRDQERSRNYPAVSLETSIGELARIKEKMGAKAFSRQQVADAFGIKSPNSGSISQKLGALRQFGLLDYKSDGITISDLGRRILIPRSEENRLAAIQEAFLRPPLYQELLKDFGNDNLPEALPNLLVHDYGLTESGKDIAAKVFSDSAEFAGYLQNGILKNAPLETQRSETNIGNGNPVVEHQESTATKPLQLADETLVEVSEKWQTVKISVTGGKSILLKLPSDLVESDISIIKAQLDVFLLQIKLSANTSQEHTEVAA